MVVVVLTGIMAAIVLPNGTGSFRDLVSHRYYDNYDVSSVLLPGVLRHLDLTQLGEGLR